MSPRVNPLLRCTIAFLLVFSPLHEPLLAVVPHDLAIAPAHFNTQALGPRLLLLHFPPIRLYRTYRFLTRTARRLRHPDILQDTLRYSLTTLLMWSTYLGTHNWEWAAIVSGLDMAASAVVRILSSAKIGRTLGAQEKEMLRYSGATSFLVGLSLLIFGTAHPLLLAIVAVANGFLMGHASLIRRRANLQPSSRTSNGHMSFSSSGARLVGYVIGFLPFAHLLRWNPATDPSQLAILFFALGSIYGIAGHLLISRASGRPATKSVGLPSPSELLMKDKGLAKRFFVLLVSNALSPGLLVIPIVAIRLVGWESAEAGFPLIALAMAYWGGSRLNLRLRENLPLPISEARLWQMGNAGSALTLLTLGLIPLASGDPRIRLGVAELLLLSFGFFQKIGHQITREAIKRNAAATAKDIYSSVIQLGTAFSGIIFASLIRTAEAPQAMRYMAYSLLAFQAALVFQPVRTVLFRNMGSVVSAIAGVLGFWVFKSSHAGWITFGTVRLLFYLICIVFLLIFPRIGHDLKNRAKINLRHRAPTPLEGHSDLGNKNSTVPLHWPADNHNLQHIPSYTRIHSDHHFNYPTMAARQVLNRIRHNPIIVGPNRPALDISDLHGIWSNVLTDVSEVIAGDLYDDHFSGDLPTDHRKILEQMDDQANASAEAGLRTIYAVGNHDIRWMTHAGENISLRQFWDPAAQGPRNVLVVQNAFFWLPDGWLGYAEHGHEVDPVSSRPHDPMNKFLEQLGDWAYTQATEGDIRMAEERRHSRYFSSVSFANIGKTIVKKILGSKFVGGFAQAVAQSAVNRLTAEQVQDMKKRGIRLVAFYGHSHIPSMNWLTAIHRETGEVIDLLVINTGDSQNSKHSNSVEIRPNGDIELLVWQDDGQPDESELDDGSFWSHIKIFARRLWTLRWLVYLIPDPRWWQTKPSKGAAPRFAAGSA